MKQMLLATVLILAPVGLFVAGLKLTEGAPVAASAASLGDLTPLAAISGDVAALIGSGDLVAAEKRATDFETLWDDDEATMRPLNAAAWGAVDDAADALFRALRTGTPDAATAQAASAGLIAVIADPAAAATVGNGGVQQVAGIAVTDATGHPLSCEDLLATLRDRIGAAAPSGDRLAQAQDLQAKATERCNADDDARADGFAAQALALLAG